MPLKRNQFGFTVTGQVGSRDESSGTVRDVSYAGPVTRLTVRLEVGGELVVLQQNLSTTSADVAALAGSRVQLVWRPEHNFRLSPAPAPASTGG